MVKTRKVLQDENSYVHVHLTTNDPNKIQIDPTTVKLSTAVPQVMVRIKCIDVVVGSILPIDRHFEIYHHTNSNELELHKLSITLPLY